MRIVSLLPSLTELVCALGREDDLVGATHEFHGLDAERLAALRPELILTQERCDVSSGVLPRHEPDSGEPCP